MEPCVSLPVGGFLGVYLLGPGDRAVVRRDQTAQVQLNLQQEANTHLHFPCMVMVTAPLLYLSV